MRQEAERATDEVEEVAPGVLRMQLPIDMPGLGHVNTYALVDKHGVALVDPGVPGKDSWDALLHRLKKAGIPLERVHTSIVTHSHHDHFGGAAQLTEETGAGVLAHHAFTTWGDDHLCTDPTHDHGDQPPRRYEDIPDRTPWGTPSDARKRIAAVAAGDFVWAAPHVTRRVRHGDVVSLCDREWIVKHTPGHTVDHVCFHDPAEGVLLSGDHVLPTITPHIGGMVDADPLDEFFVSLQAIGEVDPVSVVLPAHGHPFDDLPGRTKSIHEHHVERLEKLRTIATEHLPGWASVVEFSHHLFRERSWGQMAESETWAHLEHLRRRGQAESRRTDEGLLEYQVS
jgi:glyoxylase-like metal-dependent hydrolase (beta-lactamase superfamily II)